MSSPVSFISWFIAVPDRPDEPTPSTEVLIKCFLLQEAFQRRVGHIVDPQYMLWERMTRSPPALYNPHPSAPCIKAPCEQGPVSFFRIPNNEVKPINITLDWELWMQCTAWTLPACGWFSANLPSYHLNETLGSLPHEVSPPPAEMAASRVSRD